jgi:hypothetical protein
VFGRGADEVRVGQRTIREQIRRDFAQADRLALHFGEAHVSLVGNVAWATIVDASVAGEATWGVAWAEGEALPLADAIAYARRRRDPRAGSADGWNVLLPASGG